ncbi:unnamed protein product, partial [Rotaria sordida]
SKSLRKTSNDDDDDNNNTEEPQEKNTDIVEATSDVEDVVDDIFGKDVNDNEVREIIFLLISNIQ